MLQKHMLSVIVLLACVLLSSCRKEVLTTSSLTAVSETAVTENTFSYPYNASGWGMADAEADLLRPTFISADENGDIFYCADSGGIYKQLALKNALSKVYAHNAYTFSSIQYIMPQKISVGYRKEDGATGYSVFDLKEKTLSAAIIDPLFEQKSISSLLHYEDKDFFLADKGHYGRSTLYCQQDGKVTALAREVNEFYIIRGRIFYNAGSAVFSMNPDGSDTQLIRETPHDLSGFMVVGSQLLYSTADATYIVQMFSNEPIRLAVQLNLWTCTVSKTNAYFCGRDGGIYTVPFSSGNLFKLSDYTADSICCIGDFLYLSSTTPDAYPNLPQKQLLQGGIWRFSLSALSGEATEPTPPTSQKGAESETVSSNYDSSVDFSLPESSSAPEPERFGR